MKKNKKIKKKLEEYFDNIFNYKKGYMKYGDGFRKTDNQTTAIQTSDNLTNLTANNSYYELLYKGLAPIGSSYLFENDKLLQKQQIDALIDKYEKDISINKIKNIDIRNKCKELLSLLDMSDNKMVYYTTIIYILIDKVLEMDITDNIKYKILNKLKTTSQLLEIK